MDFIDKYKLNFTLLSDPDAIVCFQYGACNEKGRMKRTTIVIDENGKIEKVYPNVWVLGHALKVLKGLR